MVKTVAPWLCLLHVLAITCWTFPFHAQLLQFDKDYNARPLFPGESQLLDLAALAEDNPLRRILTNYIDLTGSQQYWDFFAPASPRFHQYLTLCASAVQHGENNALSCSDAPLFSNFAFSFNGIKGLPVNNSRWYRLTENLISLQDVSLINAFMRFYQLQQHIPRNRPITLLVHQFELSPGFNGLPVGGYRMDSILNSATN